MLCSKYKH